MPFKIVRNDITKMQCDAIVNTANDHPTVGSGCDYAIYNAAGYDELLQYRMDKIGYVPEGEAFITPAFRLQAEYIIHAVSPLFVDGSSGEESKLRSCYRRSLQLAEENGVKSIAFPLIATGGFGYPLEEGMRIAIDEINAFLLQHTMLVYLVVFDTDAARLGRNINSDLESYIDQNYVSERTSEEYGQWDSDSGAYNAQGHSMPYGLPKEGNRPVLSAAPMTAVGQAARRKASGIRPGRRPSLFRREKLSNAPEETEDAAEKVCSMAPSGNLAGGICEPEDDFYSHLNARLKERMKHMSDTFSEYLMYLIEEKGLTNAQVYKKAIVDKKVFSKIKNNPDYHPQKMTAMCLCIGAQLNLDEARDLLARAGYALSPCEKTDVIFSYFIENQIYDMIELDIQLEEHGLKCLIS